jgi:hypothetical protein
VSATGEVTAVSAGNALVTATYGPPAKGIRATIQVRVPPPLFAIAPDPLAFGQQNVGMHFIIADDADQHDRRRARDRRGDDHW